jgi:hypothetical protein
MLFQIVFSVDSYNCSLIFQLFEALLRVIELLKHHECAIEAETLSQLFQEMFPMWLSSTEIAITRQLESAHAVDDVASLTGICPSFDGSEDRCSQTFRVISSLFERSAVLLNMPSLDADLHQLFWDVVMRVGHQAASQMASAFSRDIQYVLIVEGGMSDSDADMCVAACVHPLSPAQFLSDLDASRKGIGGLYFPNSGWGSVLTIFSSPMHFLTPAIINRASIAHDIASLVRSFASSELNKSDDPMIALLPHASLVSLSERLLGIFDQGFHMACNMLTALSLQLIELVFAQEDVHVQHVADEIYRTCQDMFESFQHTLNPIASSSARALIFQAVNKACVMAAMQMKFGDIDGISFLDALQVKLVVQLKEFIPDEFDAEEQKNMERYNCSAYIDLFKCLTSRGVADDGALGVLHTPTQDLVFEYTKMRNGKNGQSHMGIRDLQAVLIRRARCGDLKAAEFLNSYVEEPSNWRMKFDVLDSEVGFFVASCRMRHVSPQRQKIGAIFSSQTFFRGFLILTKFHCAFVQDDSGGNDVSICFVLAQLSQFVANYQDSTLSLLGVPKISHKMFHIRVHIVELFGIAEEVTLQLSLSGQSWSTSPLRLAKFRNLANADTGSPWMESRLVCKDFPESLYPSKYQLAESPPFAVDTVPASLYVHIFKGSHVLGQGMINVGEVSSLVVNDLLIKVDMASGHSVDVRVFVTVVPASSLQQNVLQNAHIELGGFSRMKEIADRFASHLSDIGLDNTVSVNVIQDTASLRPSAIEVDFSDLLRRGEETLGKFSCTWLGQGVFNKEVHGVLVITDGSIYFFNHDLCLMFDHSIHTIAHHGLKRVRHRLIDSALSIQIDGEPAVT